MLPDASILVIGGAGSVPGPNQLRPAVLTTALYRQSTGWHTEPDTPTPRGYHTTAVVLPDGRVIVAGGEGRHPVADRDYDIFSPHYLQGNPLRPTIVAVTDNSGAALPTDPFDGTIFLDRSLPSNQTLTLTCANILDIDSLDKIVLMAPGSITHHSDMTARYVELPSGTVTNENSKRVFTLPNGNMVPNGYYMMFALNTGGTPSVAEWIKVF